MRFDNGNLHDAKYYLQIHLNWLCTSYSVFMFRIFEYLVPDSVVEGKFVNEDPLKIKASFNDTFVKSIVSGIFL